MGLRKSTIWGCIYMTKPEQFGCKRRKEWSTLKMTKLFLKKIKVTTIVKIVILTPKSPQGYAPKFAILLARGWN